MGMDYNAINIYPADEFSWGIDISVTPAIHFANEKNIFALRCALRTINSLLDYAQSA